MKNLENKANIVRVSRIIRNFLFAGLVLWILVIPAALFATIPEWYVRPASRYLQCEPLLGVFGFMVNLKLFRFFDRLKDGHLFDAKTVACLDNAGRWWVALWFVECLFWGIGHSFFQMTNAWSFDSSLFAGLTLIFVAWLLKEARDLQQEQELTV
jgi:hypothetical protein